MEKRLGELENSERIKSQKSTIIIMMIIIIIIIPADHRVKLKQSEKIST